jgi:hypothetical protein
VILDWQLRCSVFFHSGPFPERRWTVDAKKSRLEQLLLFVSSLLLLLSTLLLAYAMGVFSGPSGIFGPPVSYTGDKYTLAFMDEMDKEVKQEDLVARLDKSFKDVETTFGKPFKSRVRVVVRRELMGGLALGTTTHLPWTIAIELSAEGVDITTCRHEVVHAWLADQGHNPPYAINEGLAYFYEEDSGWDGTFFFLLLREGVAGDLDRPSGDPFNQEYQKRNFRSLATGWMMVYYLNKVQLKPLSEIATMREFPNTQVAFDELREYLRKPGNSPAPNKKVPVAPNKLR